MVFAVIALINRQTQKETIRNQKYLMTIMWKIYKHHFLHTGNSNDNIGISACWLNADKQIKLMNSLIL